MKIQRYIGIICAMTVASACLCSLAAAQGSTELPGGVDAKHNPLRMKRHLAGRETCLACHGSFNLIVRRESEPRHTLWINGDLFAQSVHGGLGCEECHTNIDAEGHRLAGASAKVRNCLPCHADAADTSELDKEQGQEVMQKLSGISSTMRPALTSCIRCHEQAYADYKESIHGVSVTNHEFSDAPFCIDCHGMHYILPPDDPQSQTNPANVPGTCLNCHDQADIKARAGFTRNIGKSFEESFHGRRGELGGTEVAVCSNCHGTHAIFAPDDPRSKVNQTRIAKTCGECHPGAELNFASAFTHSTVSKTEQLGLYILKQIYQWVIFLLIAMFVFFAMLDLFQQWRHGRRKRKLKQKKETVHV